MLLLLVVATYPLLLWFFFYQSLSLHFYMHKMYWISYGENLLFLIRQTYNFSCLWCALPGFPGCLCTALCFHAQQKCWATLTRTSFLNWFLNLLQNAVLFLLASICKDKNQTCFSPQLHPYVWVAYLFITGALGFYSSASLSSCLREKYKSRHQKENLGRPN